MPDENFIYKLNGVGNSSTGGQYDGSQTQTQSLTEDDVLGMIAQTMRTQTERMVMAGGSHQSQNFVTGVSGWQIDGQGNAEFNNGTFRGTFQIGGTLITVTAIANLQTAINTVSAAGGGTVALAPGTYSATTSFTIPSGVTVDGNGSTIDFGGGAYQFLIQGTNAYSTGGVTVNFGSTSVTGVGTAWTAGMVGQSILIGDYWYSITARASNTAITIAPAYRGLSLGMSANYVIATTIDGASVKNITLQNASGTLLRFRYCNGFTMDGLIITSGGQGIDGDDSGNVNWLNSDVDTCTVGITYDNVPFCTLKNNIVLDISGGTGIALTGVTNTAFDSISIQAVTGVGIKFTNCSNFGFSVFSIIECTSHGAELVSGNSDVDIISGFFNTCGGDGIKLTATSSRIAISETSFLNNTGYGINIANANCSNNNITAVAFTNNTAGNINNSGTSTVISADDTAYAASWNGNLGTPTKNAVYDKIETLTSTPVTDVQTFDASGTWTKPANAKSVRIQLWGGGGGGGGAGTPTNINGSGGGGGAYVEAEFPASVFGATETVTIGAGGPGGIGSGNSGTIGGNTTFGSWLTAYGGGNGISGADVGGGGGGGNKSAGGAGSGTSGGAGGGIGGGASGTVSNDATTSDGGGNGVGGSAYKGGAGGVGRGSPGTAGNSIFGGGGGGAGYQNFGDSGGTSIFGGAGGAGGNNTNGTAGTQPGGGGGGAGSAAGNKTAGKGGDGRIIVTTYF